MTVKLQNPLTTLIKLSEDVILITDGLTIEIYYNRWIANFSRNNCLRCWVASDIHLETKFSVTKMIIYPILLGWSIERSIRRFKEFVENWS